MYPEFDINTIDKPLKSHRFFYLLVLLIIPLVALLILIYFKAGFLSGGQSGSQLLETEKEKKLNWGTYSSNTFGFSFRYPNNWKVTKGKLSQNDLEQNISLSGARGELINIYLNPQNLSDLPPASDSFTASVPEKELVIQEKNINADSNIGRAVLQPININNTTYFITCDYNPKIRETVLSSFEKFLATFRFESPDIMTNWKSYTSPRGIKFKYPSDWPELEAGENDWSNSTDPFDFETIFFKPDDKYLVRLADVSQFATFEKSPLSEKVSQLRRIYKTKTAEDFAGTLLPPVNAAVAAYSRSNYIESENGQFRGVYYFANIGQYYGPELSCVMILADNKNNIVQFIISLNSDKANDFESSLGPDSLFLNYVKNLDPSQSNETIVNEFKDIFQYIALSLEA